MRDTAFRPRRRNWAAAEDRCRIEARTCAIGLVEHLYRSGIYRCGIYRCGIGWSRRPAAPLHRTFLMFRALVAAVLRHR